MFLEDELPDWQERGMLAAFAPAQRRLAAHLNSVLVVAAAEGQSVLARTRYAA